MNRIRRNFLAMPLVLLAFACTDRDPTAVPHDAAARFGLTEEDGFRFLAPIGSGAGSAALVGTLAPEVVVCRWNGAACESDSEVAAFTLAGGTGGATLRVSDDNAYHVNWNTEHSEHPIHSGETYTIVVRLGGHVIGTADIAIFANMGQARGATGDLFTLVDGRALPIRFGITPDVVFTLLDVEPGDIASADLVIQTFSTTDGTQTATVPSGRAAFRVDGPDASVPGGGTEFTLVIYEKTLSQAGECEPLYNGPNSGGCYVFETIPAGVTFYDGNQNPVGLAGVCPDANATPAHVLAKHDNGETTFPPPSPVNIVACGAQNTNGLHGWLRGLARLVLPRPLYATDEGESGLVGAFSTIFWAAPVGIEEAQWPTGPVFIGQPTELSFRVVSTHTHQNAQAEPVAGVLVEFSASNGTLSPQSAVSDEDGLVTVSWTPASTGPNTVTATVTGASGPDASITFQADVVIGQDIISRGSPAPAQLAVRPEPTARAPSSGARR